MKPHRRKPTPPRRESGSPPGSDPAGEVNDVPVEGYDLADETVSYDPGAALADQNEVYGEEVYDYAAPHTGYDENQQAYPDPGYDPSQVYAESEHYYDPNQVYAEPSRIQESGYPEPASAPGGVYDEVSEEPVFQVSPPPLRTVKKKAAGRAPQRRPLATPRKVPGAGYQRPRPSYNSGGGISVMTVFLTLMAMVMLAVVTLVVLPRDMSGVSGYPVNPLTASPPRNLLEEAQKTMVTRTADLSFTEEEVNQYLNHRLQAEQTGPIGALVKFRGIYIDFTPGLADIIIERELFGMPLTMSATVSTDKFRQQTTYHATNWRLGRIDLGKRNIKPVMDLFMRLRMSCLDEFQTLQQMIDVRFEEDKVVLDATF